jgi:uncharacterized protein YkwD
MRSHARTPALAAALVTYLIAWAILSTATAHAACARASAAPTSAPAARSSTRTAIRCLVNEQRRRHGLAPVRSSGALRRAADGLAGDMVRRKFFAHVTPGGSTVDSRVRSAGYLGGALSWSLGETLAWGAARAGTAAALVNALMHSPPHRAIILSPQFREVGVGVAFGVPASGAGAAGATIALDFGSRTVRHRVRPRPRHRWTHRWTPRRAHRWVRSHHRRGHRMAKQRRTAFAGML